MTTYGGPLAKGTLPTAKKLGTVVGTDSVPKGTADYTSVASKVLLHWCDLVAQYSFLLEACANEKFL